MCMNALVYNKVADEYWNAALHFFLNGTKFFESAKRTTKITAYGQEAQAIIQRNESIVSEVSIVGTKRKKRDTAGTSTGVDVVVRVNVESTGTEPLLGDPGSADLPTSALDDENEVNGSQDKPRVSSEDSIEDEDGADLDESLQLNIPTVLTQAKDPQTYIQPTLFAINSDEAYFQIHQDCCFLCGSGGSQDKLLFCVDCGEAIHDFCSNIPGDALVNIRSKGLQNYNWRCMNCKICSICECMNPEDVDNVIFCESCDNAFHIQCLDPPLPESVRESKWYCHDCITCANCVHVDQIPCWGVNLDCCIRCFDAKRHKSDASALCSVCSNLCLSDQRIFVCTICDKRSHFECYDLKDFEALFRADGDSIVCESCREHDDRIAELDHVDEDGIGKELHYSAAYLKLMDLKTLEAIVDRSEAKIYEHNDTYSYYPLTVIVWATVRLMIVDNSPARVANNPKYRLIYSRSLEDQQSITSPASPSWQYIRARKFLNYFRRHKKLGFGSPMSSGQMSGLQLLELSPSSLSTLAVLAASFTAVSDSQQTHTMRCFVESVIVVIEVALIITRHRNPLVPMSLDLLNFFFSFFSSSQCFTLARPCARLPMPKDVHINSSSSVELPSTCGADQQRSAQIDFPLSSSASTNHVPSASQRLSESTKHVAYKFTEAEFAIAFDFIRDFLHNLGGLFEQDMVVVSDFLMNTVKKSFSCKPIPCVASTVSGAQTSQLAASGIPQPAYPPVQQVVYLSRLKLLRGMQIARAALLHPPVIAGPPVAITANSSEFALLKSALLASTPVQSSILKPRADSLHHLPPAPSPWVVQSFLHSKQHLPDPSPSTEGVDARSNAKKSVKEKSDASSEPVMSINRELMLSVLSTGYGSLDMANEVIRFLEMTASQIADAVAHCKGDYADQSENAAHFEDSRINSSISDETVSKNFENSSPQRMPLVTVGVIPLEPSDGADSMQSDTDKELDSDEQIISTPLSPTCEAAIAPLNGWSPDSSSIPWKDVRLCCLCQSGIEDRLHGRLVPFSDGLYTHVNCLQWCTIVQHENPFIKRAIEARDVSLSSICHYCHLKGASLRCSHSSSGRRQCKRSYHLSCAIAAHCALIEMPVSEGKRSVEKNIFCPFHILEIQRLQSAQSLTLWSPDCNDACIIIDDNAVTTDSEDLADLLVLRRGDKVLRMGAFSLLYPGNINNALPGLTTPSYIYPRNYRSARIFWSTSRAWTRTLYIFEVLYECDVADYDLPQLEYIQDCIYSVHSNIRDKIGEESDNHNVNMYTDSWLIGPIFRVVALDDLQQPLFAKSIDVLYSFLVDRVAECNLSASRLYSRRSPKCAPSFGLTGHQFFGFGIPIVRRTIEKLPNSFDCMIYNKARPSSTMPSVEGEMSEAIAYKPVFVLPTSDQIQAFCKQRAALQVSRINKSICGSSRADPLARSSGERLPSRKLLAKSVDHEASNPGGSADTELDIDIERENSKVQEENRRQRYIAMSKAYVINPNARLEVKKSRIHNWGLFARMGFEKDDVIVEYIGEKVRTVVADKREAQYEQEGVGSCYLFR